MGFRVLFEDNKLVSIDNLWVKIWIENYLKFKLFVFDDVYYHDRKWYGRLLIVYEKKDLDILRLSYANIMWMIYISAMTIRTSVISEKCDTWNFELYNIIMEGKNGICIDNDVPLILWII